MRTFLHPVALVGVIVAALGFVVGSLPVGLLGVVAYVGAIAILTMRRPSTSPVFDMQEMDPESRRLLRPFLKLRDELGDLVDRNRHLPNVSVVGKEAIAEADAILGQAQRLTQARFQLARTLRGKSEAEMAVRKLEEQLQQAATDAERQSLASAISASTEEGSHYTKLEETIADVDRRIRQAEAALSELKARLTVGAAGAAAEGALQDELGDAVGRLRALGKSFDEAETMLEQRVR